MSTEVVGALWATVYDENAKVIQTFAKAVSSQFDRQVEAIEIKEVPQRLLARMSKPPTKGSSRVSPASDRRLPGRLWNTRWVESA